MNAFAAASAAYKATGALDQRPAAVLAAAHQELAARIAWAVSAYEAERLDEMCRHTARAAQLVSALITAIQGHSPQADRLAGHYARLRTALNGMSTPSHDMETISNGLDWVRALTRLYLSEAG